MTTASRLYWAAAIFTVGGLWLLYSAADPRDGTARVAELREKVEESQRDNAHMALEIEETRVLIDDVKNNPLRLEEVARHRLQMIKPGEVLVLPAE